MHTVWAESHCVDMIHYMTGVCACLSCNHSEPKYSQIVHWNYLSHFNATLHTKTLFSIGRISITPFPFIGNPTDYYVLHTATLDTDGLLSSLWGHLMSRGGVWTGSEGQDSSSP